MKRLISLLVVVLAIAIAAPAMALTLSPGIDVWETSRDGAYIDFSDNPIPAGTFCADSPAFSGQIPVRGRRLNASPDLGSTDTIIERLNGVDLEVGGAAGAVDIAIRVLSVAGRFTACGSSWAVDAYTDPNNQPTSKLLVKATSSSGGTFSANLDVNGTVRFVSDKGTITLTDKVNLVTNNASWATNPPGSVKTAGPVKVDSNADGVQDLALPGTSNFHPGWNGPIPVPVPHSGPHPTLPPAPCSTTTTTTTALSDGGVVHAPAPTPVPHCTKPVIVTEVTPISVISVLD